MHRFHRRRTVPVSILLCILFGILGIHAQNLLINGSFEDENICTEFTKNCAPEAWVCTFNASNHYIKDATVSFQGLRCIALEAGNSSKPFQRTLIRTLIPCQLRKGNNYQISMYVKSAVRVLDSVGIFFSTTDFLFEQRPHYRLPASVYFINATKQIKNDDTSWQKVVLEYLATGNERFVTIGNFSTRDVTGNPSKASENRFLFYVDEVSIISLNPNEKPCPDWHAKKTELYEQNERHYYLERYLKVYKSRPPVPKVSSTSIQTIDTVILPDILFASGKAILQPASHKVLDSFCNAILGKTIDTLVITGHTDNLGSQIMNESLSENRAVTVAAYIQSRMQLEPGRINTQGLASRSPRTDNKTAGARQLNRRVEIYSYVRE